MDKNDTDHLDIFNRLTKIETRFDNLELQVREMRQELIVIKSLLVGNGRIGVTGRLQRIEDSLCFVKAIAYVFGLIAISLVPLACSSLSGLVIDFLK